MRFLRGKRALVTGAASGLGVAIALRLAREGVHLHLMDIDDLGLKSVVERARDFGIAARALQCDLTQPEEITKSVDVMLDNWGCLDILVNNAGVAFYGPTVKMTREQWDWLLAVNLHAPIQLVHELLPALLARKEAHIVNVASIAGLVAGGRFCAYHVSKYGLVGMSEALRAEFGRQGLGVSAVCPGPVLTNLYKSAPNSHRSKPTPIPPAWICTTPERVADKTVRAIRRDKRLVLVSPMAYGLYYAKRLAPGLLDGLQHMGRRRQKTNRKIRPTGLADQVVTKSREERAPPKRPAA